MPASPPKPNTTSSDAIPLERVDRLRYIAHEYELEEIALRLKRHGYRGAICGPAGSGKTTMLQALGDELMAHGYSPLTLCLEQDRKKALPKNWFRTIRKARHTDALLLDDYDLLPWWARAWVWATSMRAGAVVVTAKRDMRFKTLARPKPTAALLKQLVEQLAPTKAKQVNCASIFEQCQGNLSDALRLVCTRTTRPAESRPMRQKQAS